MSREEAAEAFVARRREHLAAVGRYRRREIPAAEVRRTLDELAKAI